MRLSEGNQLISDYQVCACASSNRHRFCHRLFNFIGPKKDFLVVGRTRLIHRIMSHIPKFRHYHFISFSYNCWLWIKVNRFLLSSLTESPTRRRRETIKGCVNNRNEERFLIEGCNWLRHSTIISLVFNRHFGRSRGPQLGSPTVPKRDNPSVTDFISFCHLMPRLSWLFPTHYLPRKKIGLWTRQKHVPATLTYFDSEPLRKTKPQDPVSYTELRSYS